MLGYRKVVLTRRTGQGRYRHALETLEPVIVSRVTSVLSKH